MGAPPFPKPEIHARLGQTNVTGITEDVMAEKESLAATRQALTSLAAAVLRLRSDYGDTLGVRRLTSDVDRLNADLDELGPPAPGVRPPVAPEERITIPDEPYDESMWQDAQTEAQHAQ
jgi:hypothetical protein